MRYEVGDPARANGGIVTPMEAVLRIFIGYDPREAVAYHVLSHSILSRATCPVAITPLVRTHLRGWYWRERGPQESTDFARSRFIVPALCGYQGHAVFMDCDMLCRVDIGQLWNEILAQPDTAVLCCQHDYTPKMGTKFLGQQQTDYPRKNWSSFMVFNNAMCHALTPSYVNKATGLELHRFHWLGCDCRIGALPVDWNWLVGEYPSNPHAKILHFTRGGPWFEEFRTCDHAAEWFAEVEAMQAIAQAVG